MWRREPGDRSGGAPFQAVSCPGLWARLRETQSLILSDGRCAVRDIRPRRRQPWKRCGHRAAQTCRPHPREGMRRCGTSSSAEKTPRLWCAKRRAMSASYSPTGNRRIPVRSPAVGVPSASCTGEAPPMWSAVCSQPSMGGRHHGAKMTRGGGRLTSRAPTRARSASAPPGQ